MKGADWERGYKDGWDGATPMTNPFKDYLKGFAAGDKDRRYGRSAYPLVANGPPGTKMSR